MRFSGNGIEMTDQQEQALEDLRHNFDALAEVRVEMAELMFDREDILRRCVVAGLPWTLLTREAHISHSTVAKAVRESKTVQAD